MRRSNAELVREILEALNRADVDGMLANMHPDFKWTPLEDSLVSGSYRGHDQVRRYVLDWLAVFDDLELKLEEVSAIRDEVVVEVQGSVRGHASGIELENRFCQVWTIHDGRAIRMREYRSYEEALASCRRRPHPPGPKTAESS